jgi:translation initiation factor 1
VSDEKKPFNNPFGALGGLREALPQGPATATGKAAAAQKLPPKAVVRMERAGRNGKEVTVIEQLDLPVEQRDGWLKELKASLGCGGTIEGVALVLQGDHRERAAKWLTKRGVKKVSVG